MDFLVLPGRSGKAKQSKADSSVVLIETDSDENNNVNTETWRPGSATTYEVQFNSIQKSFIVMRKQTFTLPKQVTKQYSEIQLQMGKAYTVGGNTLIYMS